VAGPSAGATIDVEANKFHLDISVQALPVRNVELLPAPARRAEADGAGCRHLSHSFFLFLPLFATGFCRCPPHTARRWRHRGAWGRRVTPPCTSRRRRPDGALTPP